MSVVHCKRDSFDIYIGRPSKWGNPFTIGKHGSRATVIELYRRDLWDRIKNEDDDFLHDLAALDGKKLGCFCAPQACHGDVLVSASRWAKSRLATKESLS